MNKRISLSAAAVFAVSAIALQTPLAGAAGNSSSSGVPGVELNAGNDASDRGLPGVEANIGGQGDQSNDLSMGRDGDQNNLDTRTLGAGAESSDPSQGSESSTMGANADSTMGADGSVSRPLRADRG